MKAKCDCMQPNLYASITHKTVKWAHSLYNVEAKAPALTSLIYHFHAFQHMNETVTLQAP